MSVEIKTSTLEPVRNTYTTIAARFGDKPATRYQEASYDIQGVTNFHYHPAWQQQYLINDENRTQIKMQDWYVLKDPRQYYYASYVANRAKMQESAENSYSFFEKRKFAEYLSDEIREKLIRFVIPFRHVEQTANLNNTYGVAYGYGTVLTQALCYDAMDRLGIAQYFSKIGLILDENTGDALIKAKAYWMEDPAWQGIRALCEELLVTEDWFELIIAQDVVVDSLIGDLLYNQFDQWLTENNGRDVTMLFEFMHAWKKDRTRWIQSVIKTTVQESEENRVLITAWAEKWREKTRTAIEPLTTEMFGSESLDRTDVELNKLLQKVGVQLGETHV